MSSGSDVDGLFHSHHNCKIGLTKWFNRKIWQNVAHVRMICKMSPKTPFCIPSGVSAASQMARNRQSWPLYPALIESNAKKGNKKKSNFVCNSSQNCWNVRFQFSFENLVKIRACHQTSSRSQCFGFGILYVQLQLNQKQWAKLRFVLRSGYSMHLRDCRTLDKNRWP